jgi:N6-adenosine-specific RNA methylase IME4
MSLGLGYWFRGQVEVCFLGVRGNIKAFRSQEPNFIQTKARAHSQKPDHLYGIIETLNLNPKIELFAREQREGWDTWGNQIPKTMQKVFS